MRAASARGDLKGGITRCDNAVTIGRFSARRAPAHATPTCRSLPVRGSTWTGRSRSSVTATLASDCRATAGAERGILVRPRFAAGRNGRHAMSRFSTQRTTTFHPLAGIARPSAPVHCP
jgi:hypothetical protein